MKNAADSKGDRIATVSNGELQLDLTGFEARRALAVITGAEPSLLDSGDYVVELEGGRVHSLSLAANPPAGDYTVVILDPNDPGMLPETAEIQIREHRD